jgi:tRNA threonylcarbamoyladenosine biosynthesis protein TsaB
VPVLLAVDTSGKNGSIALARVPAPKDKDATPEVLEVVPLAGGTFSAQLVPQIADLLARHGFNKNDISAFAVVSGPGSFTGLRVGLAAIKALSEVLAKPIAAISLLEAIAVSGKAKGRMMAALEAGRGEVYAGDYEVSGDAMLVEERLLGREEFVEAAKTKPVVTPDSTLAELVQRSGSNAHQIAYPSTAVIVQLGWKKIQSGQTVSPADLEANYIRRSDAEIFSKPK